MKLTLNLDQHDLIGIAVIVAAFMFKAFNLIDGNTLLGALTVGSGFILGSNTKLMSGNNGSVV